MYFLYHHDVSSVGKHFRYMPISCLLRTHEAQCLQPEEQKNLESRTKFPVENWPTFFQVSTGRPAKPSKLPPPPPPSPSPLPQPPPPAAGLSPSPTPQQAPSQRLQSNLLLDQLVFGHSAGELLRQTINRDTKRKSDVSHVVSNAESNADSNAKGNVGCNVGK